MSVFASLARQLIMLTVELLPIDGKRTIEIKNNIGKDIAAMMSAYEAELFQDRYLPEYQKHEREISRREKAEAEAKRKRDLEALSRVASLSEDAG